LVVIETLKAFTARGKTPALYHLRAQDGTEVDLILDLGTALLPIEIKLTGTPSMGHFFALRAVRQLTKAQWHAQSWLVCTATQEQVLSDGQCVIPWQKLPEKLAEILGE